jgi:Phage integrase, N-terminal SAM-like domain
MHPGLRPQGQRASKADCPLPGHSKERTLVFAGRRESAGQDDDRSFRPPHAIRDTTHDGYKRHLENHVMPVLGGMRLQDLTTVDLNELWARLAKSGRLDGKGGLSSRTIRSLNHLISQTLVDAQVQGLVVKNVAVGVTLPAATRS